MKKMQSFRLSQEFDDVLTELSHEDRLLQYGDVSGSKAANIEAMCAFFVRLMLEKKCDKQLLSGYGLNTLKLFKLYTSISRAERGEPGYKIYKRDGLILNVRCPENLEKTEGAKNA